MFFLNRGNLIGVDIGSYAVKAVKIKGKGDNRSLEAVGYSKIGHINIPQDNLILARLLRTIFNTHKINAKKIAAIFSGGSLIHLPMYLPNMPRKDMKEAVRWEMQKHITFPHDELVYDFTTIGEVKKGEDLMVFLIAFGAQKNDVKQLINIFEDASLEPISINVTPMAMLASFDYNNIWDANINYSMIDIGDLKSTVAIFKDKKLMFTREIPIAGKGITTAVMQKLACNENIAEMEKIRCQITSSNKKGTGIEESIAVVVEQLAAEVHRSFDYYQAQFRESGINKLFLCGGSSKLKGIDDFFANILGVPCFIDDPLRNIKIESKKFEIVKIKEFATDLSIAVGLAI